MVVFLIFERHFVSKIPCFVHTNQFSLQHWLMGRQTFWREKTGIGYGMTGYDWLKG